jgi:2-dehydropantoate 2-reductase
MHFLITGPGAIGCLYACLLKEAGNSVQILDKDQERADSINRDGIQLDDGTIRSVPVEVITDASEAQTPDYICICVKSFDTESAIKLALPAAGDDTHFVSIQNGIGNAETIASYTDISKVICVATSQGATRVGPGQIRRAGEGPTSIAACTMDSDKAAYKLEVALNDAGIECCYQEDEVAMLWSKLIVNAAINPLTASADVTNGEILKSEDLAEVMRNAAEEAESVARKRNIHLYYDSAVNEAERICRATSENISSMLQDIKAGRRTEIDAITGAIIKEAKALQIDVPTHEALYERVKKLEEQTE